jgi:hypothetical protein
MKVFILVISFLFTICSEAQINLPHAGQIPSGTISREAIIQSMRSGTSPSLKSLDVIDFDSSNVSFRGNYPFSISYSLAMSPAGDLVFVGSGGGIYITDVSDPNNPVVLSEVRTRSLVDDCTYDSVNHRLYVCAYFSGVEIWDLSDLYNPVRMCRIPTEPYPRSGVAYSGNYLFVTTNYTIWSYDISDPYHPAIAGQLYLGNSLISQLYMKGNIIYITSSIQGLKLIDISDPSNLQLIHAYSYIAGYEFDISGDYLYAVKTTGELTILNISDSLNVNVVSSINLSGYPYEIAVFNNTAYVAKGGTGGGLQVVDVTDPESPVPVSLYSGDYQFIKGSGNYVYLTRNSDFSVLDVTDPLSVQYVSGYEIPGFVEDVAVRGNYAYTGSNGFRVIDVSDSTHPVQAGYADVAGDLVEPAGSSLVVYCPYSMTANNTVHIMDVSDPANPVSMGSYTCPAMTWDLKVRDTLAYVACWWDGVRIFNFADPSNLTQISHVMGWQQGGIAGVDWCYAQAIDVEGNYLYIVDYGPFPSDDTYGLYIIDISDPANPFLLSRFTGITSHANDMAVKDSMVYIADGNGGVETVDVSDPVNPSVLGYISVIDGATGIKTEGKYAYVSDYILGGIQVVDISDPTAPSITGYYKPSGCFALNVDYNNGFIYIADGLAGIQIYRNLLITPVAIIQENATINNFRLEQNYPNPFNPTTTIKYAIPKTVNVELKVFDILGREVKTLVNETRNAGYYRVQFNASNYVSGVYFYRLKAGDYIKTGKMLLLK